MNCEFGGCRGFTTQNSFSRTDNTNGAKFATTHRPGDIYLPILFRDSFELTAPETGATARVVVGFTDTDNGGVNGTAGDYFYRTNLANDTTIGANATFDTGIDGSYFFRGEDVRDATDPRNNDNGVITWSGIDITGETDLSFTGLFTARTFSTLLIESNDYLRVSYSIDGGAEVTGLQFLGTGTANTWVLDEDLSGAIEADETISLTEDFVEYGFNIDNSAGGTTLDLIFEDNDHASGAENRGGVGEEIGIDNFRIASPDAPVNTTGTEADETLDGAEANDTIDGAGGNDIINGFGGADVLTGGAGDDEVNGGAGDDEIVGGAGADALDGGSGTDLLTYRSKAAVAVNLEDATLNMGDAAGDTHTGIEEFFLSVHDDNFFGDISNSTVDGQNGNDNMNGKGGDDILFGRNGNDFLSGGGGNDRVNGGNDDDQVFGNGGNDRLFGGSGDDELTGGDGLDIMIGGSGADTFIFDVADTDGVRDFILQWEDGTDTIRYENSSQTFADLTFTAVGAHTLITSDFGILTLYGTAPADFDASDFEFVPVPVGANGVAEALEAAPKPALYAADDSGDGGVFDVDAFDVG